MNSPKNAKLSLRLEEDLREWIAAKANQRRVSDAVIVREMLWREKERQAKPEGLAA